MILSIIYFFIYIYLNFEPDFSENILYFSKGNGIYTCDMNMGKMIYNSKDVKSIIPDGISEINDVSFEYFNHIYIIY